MSKQPVFLKVGLNYPTHRDKKDQRGLLLWVMMMLLVAQTITIGALYVALEKAWENERAASHEIQTLHQAK